MSLKSYELDKIRENIVGELFFYESVGSTNTEALKSIGAKDMSLFIAENQTEGRGRRGRQWEAASGGIYMTVLLKRNVLTADMPVLTLLAGLAVSRAIPKSQIKWPNDIILGDKKAAGILVESKILGESAVVAVGIGINANNMGFSAALTEKATSIYLFTGERQDEAELILRVYNEFMRLYSGFEKGFSQIADEYRARCITLNREISVIRDGKECVMRAVGIGEKGELIAEADGKTEKIGFGEVSVRGILGYV